MDVIIKVDEIIKVLKKTGYQFFKENQVPKGTKQPYFTYRGTYRMMVGDNTFAFKHTDDTVDVMKSNVYLKVLNKWQVAMDLTFWGEYDRASAEMQPMDYVIQAMNKIRGSEGIPINDVNQSKWKIGMYKLFFWGFGWNIQQGHEEKESDRKTNVNLIIDVMVHSDKIAIPTPDETEDILKESKKLEKDIKKEV